MHRLLNKLTRSLTTTAPAAAGVTFYGSLQTVAVSGCRISHPISPFAGRPDDDKRTGFRSSSASPRGPTQQSPAEVAAWPTKRGRKSVECLVQGNGDKVIEVVVAVQKRQQQRPRRPNWRDQETFEILSPREDGEEEKFHKPPRPAEQDDEARVECHSNDLTIGGGGGDDQEEMPRNRVEWLAVEGNPGN